MWLSALAGLVAAVVSAAAYHRWNRQDLKDEAETITVVTVGAAVVTLGWALGGNVFAGLGLLVFGLVVVVVAAAWREKRAERRVAKREAGK